MKMTGGQALVRQLIAEGIDDVFGVPGVQLDWAVEAFRQERDKIRLVVPRHEQATSYMADGYARSTGKIGTCMVVPGPGLLNAMAGLSTAYACNSRVLCIAGNIYSPMVGKNVGLLHEVRDQTGFLRSVTKWQGAAQTAASIPALVREAVKQLRSGTPQPVGIEISHDILASVADVDLISPPKEADDRLKPDPVQIASAAAVLEKAKHPVIYVGGGALAARATVSLTKLAERLKAPVVMGENGRGALSDRHPLAMNVLAGREVFRSADVVLVVGSRFVDSMFGKTAWPDKSIKYVFLNSDVRSWAPPQLPAATIHADAALGCEALAAEVSAREKAWADFDQMRSRAQVEIDSIRPQADLARALRAAIPDDGILVSELTQVGYFARVGYPVYEAGTFIAPGYQGTLGYGFPTALGSAIGNPDRAVVSITGDGGFGWSLQELATAKKYGVPLVTVLFNDGHFGNVRRLQREQFGENFEVKLENPDFELLTRAFGVDYQSADPARLELVLREAIASRRPVLIEVKTGEMPTPWNHIRLTPPQGA